MDVVQLEFKQIFQMTGRNLMKRISQFFEQTQNASKVVEVLVAILMRGAVCRKDFSIDPLTDLIRHIFLTTAPNDILRKNCVYFEEFFTGKADDGREEWSIVLDRLFIDEAEYREFTKETCLYKDLIEKMSREMTEDSDDQFKIVSTFKDANGRRRTLTLHDTKLIPKNSQSKIAEVAEVLKVLTTLTIFQTSDNVCRFAEYVKYRSPKTCIEVEHEAEASQAKTEDSVQASVTTTTPQSTRNNSKTPQKQVSTVSSSAGKTKINDALIPQPEEAPPTELKGCSAAPNPSTTEKPPVKKSAKRPELRDTSYMRYDKTEERVKKDRLDKDMKKILDKEKAKSGKGKKKSKNTGKKKGKNYGKKKRKKKKK